MIRTIEPDAPTLYRESLPLLAREPHLRGVIEDTLGCPGALKRLRLALLAGRVTGLPRDVAAAFATGVEYFHTASLILDDLPSMDDAAMRRSQPCVHRRHGEPAATLGALAFINRGYALVWSALGAATPTVREVAAANIEYCLSVSGVLDGQSLDVHFAESDRSPRTVASVAMGKTVSLLRLALLTPAILAGARRREQRLLDRVAVYWGLAYQLADDFADLEAGLPMGKTSGRDSARNRPNYVRAAGREAARRRLLRLLGLLSATVADLVSLRPAWEALAQLTENIGAEVLQDEPAPADELCPA